MIFLLITLAMFLSLGLVFLTLVWARPWWIILAALTLASVLELFQVGVTGLQYLVNVYPIDAVCFVLVGTGVVAFARYRKRIPIDVFPSIFLILMMALNFARGINIYGLRPAGNGARDIVYFASPALAIMLVRPAMRVDVSRVAHWLAVAGLCLSGLALLRWTGLLATPEVGFSYQYNMREVPRVLVSDYAFIIGAAFISAIYLRIVERRGKWWWAAVWVLGGVTLALQHRSVWASTIVGLIWFLFRTLRLSPFKLFAAIVGTAIVLGTAMLAVPQVMRGVDKLVTDNSTEVVRTDSTWAWRVQGYKEAIDRMLASEWGDLMIGPPSGWAANSSGSFASLHIHSRYINTFASYGIVGLTFLLAWLGLVAKRVGWPARSTRQRNALQYGGSTLLEALLLCSLVYFVPYFGGMLQGTVLGLIWVAAKYNLDHGGARSVARVNYDYNRAYATAGLPNYGKAVHDR